MTKATPCICGQDRQEHADGDGYCERSGCFKYRPAGVHIAAFDFDASCEALMSLHSQPSITERIQ